MERGESCEYVRSDDGIVIVEWKDNQKVVLASKCTGIEPGEKVKRWSKKDAKYIEIDCPAIVRLYNKNLGGIDIFDQQMECYRTWFKTKKWTLKCILHFLDFSVVNSWFTYREDCRANKIPKQKTLDLLKFRMAIAESLMATQDRKRMLETEEEVGEKECVPAKKMKIYMPSPKPVFEKRFDGYDHWPVLDSISSPRCCQLESCKSRTKSRCTKCDMYLCIAKDKTVSDFFIQNKNIQQIICVLNV